MISEEETELKCHVCQVDFDLGDHIPKMLPDCGHSFCLKCLAEGLSNSTEALCPICDMENCFESIEKFKSDSKMIDDIKKKISTQQSSNINIFNPSSNQTVTNSFGSTSSSNNDDNDLQDLINRYVKMKIDDDNELEKKQQEDQIREEQLLSSSFLKQATISDPKPTTTNSSVHKKITCDICEQCPIRGNRYKCKTCPSYDMCESCFSIVDHGHQFYKFVKPIGGICVAIHEGVRCDGCRAKPIIGKRFKCHACENYDFCEDCMETRTHAHGFIQINEPLNGFTFVIHPKIRCKQCGVMDLIGMRYKCKECEDFDLCQICYLNINHGHPFFEIGTN